METGHDSGLFGAVSQCKGHVGHIAMALATWFAALCIRAWPYWCKLRSCRDSYDMAASQMDSTSLGRGDTCGGLGNAGERRGYDSAGLFLCPGVLHSGCFDPEGPLCIISATALALMGYCAGWLSRSGCRMCRQVLFFSLLGGLCVAVGSQCGLVIKGIWTPAFVLIAGGIGYLLLALFRPACDAWSKGEKFSMPLRVVGMNALFIYLVTHLPGYQELLQEVVRPILSFCASGATLDILCDFLQVGGAWLICYVLWRKRIFIKV